MTMTAVSRCSECEAMVNIHWSACLVCQANLSPVPEVRTLSEVTPDSWGRTGDLHLKPGSPIERSDNDAVRLLAKKPDAVKPAFEAGDWVEWLSPALPKQQGEVLAVHPDGTFEVFHPLTEALCRLPVSWVTKVFSRP